jgi:hypothetical protein
MHKEMFYFTDFCTHFFCGNELHDLSGTALYQGVCRAVQSGSSFRCRVSEDRRVCSEGGEFEKISSCGRGELLAIGCPILPSHGITDDAGDVPHGTGTDGVAYRGTSSRRGRRGRNRLRTFPRFFWTLTMFMAVEEGSSQVTISSFLYLFLYSFICIRCALAQ